MSNSLAGSTGGKSPVLSPMLGSLSGVDGLEAAAVWPRIERRFVSRAGVTAPSTKDQQVLRRKRQAASFSTAPLFVVTNITGASSVRWHSPSNSEARAG